MSSSIVIASRTPKSTVTMGDRSTTKNAIDIEMKIVEGKDLADSHRLRFKPSYFVEVEVDQDKQRTCVRQKEKESTKWDETFMFAANLSSCLIVRIYCHHDRVGADHVIGEARLDILKQSRNQNIDIDLDMYTSANATATSPTLKKLCGRLTLYLRVSILATFSRGAVDGLDLGSIQSLETFGFIKSLTPDQFRQISPSWRRFMISLNTFCMLASAIAELSPKAKVAVGAVSFAIKIVIDQVNRDDKIQGLIDIMNDLYYFFLDADPMQKILSYQKTVERLLLQTTECSYFIAEYLKTESIVQRAMLHMVSNADSMIVQFEGAFGELKIELILGTSLQTALVSFRILDKVENILNLMYIDQLPYSRSAGWDLDRTCLRGTCQAIIDDVVCWASDTNESQLFLLSGPPGCGKSAIAHTISQIFHQQKRLGAAVFLDSRCADHEVHSQTVSSTIAFQLASYDTKIKERMAERLSSGDHLASADVGRQFPELIAASLKDLTIVGPIVVVIDGLPDPVEQHRLLTTIINSSIHLPSNVRLLLTSRHDPMIPAMLAKTREIGFQDSREPSLGLETLNLSDYIYRCLDDHLFSKSSFSEEYNRQELHDQLVRQAMSMDFWVSLIWRILSACSNREKRIFLDIIQTYEPPRSKKEAMDHIYHAFLAILPYPTPVAHSIFDTFIKSPQPLPWTSPGVLVVILIEKSLDNQGLPLFSVHPSFEDFLTDKRRVGSHDNEYYVDRQQVGPARLPWLVGAPSLEEMNHSLKHNLFDLELMALNHEVLDKLAHIRQSVPEFFQYACCNWIRHVEAIVDIEDAAAVMTALRTFLFTHLLHWFEVMSLLGFLDTVLPSLERLAVWLKDRAPEDLREMTSDAIRFIRTFSPMISRAAMQTYISALPLMPSDTLLFEHYRKEHIAGRSNLTSYTHTTRWKASVPEGTPLFKPSKEFSSLTPVAYQGYLIARYDRQLGIFIYDSRTGLIGTVLITGPLSTMAFSPDGQQIVTASDNLNGSIVIWEVKTGKPVKHISSDFGKPFVCYSSDGTRIMAIGTSISTFSNKSMVWDATTDSCKVVKEFNLPILGTFAIALSGRQLAISQESMAGGAIINILRIGADSKDEERLPADTSPQKQVLRAATKLRGSAIKFSKLVWSPHGNLLAASLNNSTICLWSMGHGSTPRLTLHLPTKEAGTPQSRIILRQVAFSFDSLYITSLHTFDTEVEEDNVLISVWDTNVGGLRFQKEFKGSLSFYGPSISFLPDSYDIFVHLDPDDTAPPIHFVGSTNLSIPFESNVLTIEYSHLPSDSRSAPNGHIDSDGWISNTAGERQMWVPYPNYEVVTEHVPYSGREGSYRGQVLRVKHPKTKDIVLRFVINFKDTPESGTSERSGGN